MTTLTTAKHLLTLAVCLFGMTAHPTHTAGVSWVNDHDRHSRKFCFVGDEHSQLIERPTMSLGSLCLSNRSSTPDAREVFKGYRRVCVFGSLNELLGNAVVYIRTEASFTTTDLPQLSLTCFRLLSLQSTPLFQVAKSDFLYLLAGEHLPIAGYGNLVYSEVYPDDVLWIDGRVFGHVGGSIQIELAITIYQVHLTYDAVSTTSIVFSDDDVEQFATFQCGQRNLGVWEVHSLEGQNALVVSDTTTALELRLHLFVEFVCLAGLGNRPDGELCGQVKLLPDVLIHQFLDGEFGSGVFLEASFSNVIAGIVECFHCFQKHFLPFCIRQEFDFGGCLHTLSKRPIDFFFNNSSTISKIISTMARLTHYPKGLDLVHSVVRLRLTSSLTGQAFKKCRGFRRAEG